jgi:hypothetical protein
MGQLVSSRRAALDGLSRIMDATAPEELFTGPEEDAAFLYELLSDVARARSSSHYWEICRTARRRGVTAEYVIDRAVVLLATIEERRRADLYRIIGVPALATGDTIRQRWLDLAKEHHPDVGGDGASFRRVKEAYEILRDPTRRVEYERFWLRALGPFERVATRDDVPRVEGMASELRVRARAAGLVAPRPVPALRFEMPAAPSDGRTAPAWLPRRAMYAPSDGATSTPQAADGAGGELGIPTLFGRVEALLAPISRAELDLLRNEVTRAVDRLETMRDELAALAAIKRRLGI